MEPLFYRFTNCMRKSGEVIASKTEFGYDIPSEYTGEYWAISAHPNGVSYVKMENMLVSTWQSFTRINQNFLETPRLVFSFVDQDFGR